jgi:hypothetical protein
MQPIYRQRHRQLYSVGEMFNSTLDRIIRRAKHASVSCSVNCLLNEDGLAKIQIVDRKTVPVFVGARTQIPQNLLNEWKELCCCSSALAPGFNLLSGGPPCNIVFVTDDKQKVDLLTVSIRTSFPNAPRNMRLSLASITRLNKHCGLVEINESRKWDIGNPEWSW